MRLSCFFLMMAIFAIPSLGQDLLNDVEVKEFEIPGIPLSPGSVSTHSFEPREVGDLNGDGQTELVGLSRYGSLSGVDMGAASAMEIANLHETFDDAVMLSLLDGNFSSLSNEPLWLAVQSANSKGRFAIYSSGADINSDGWLELVCGTAPSDEGLNGRVHLLSGADGSVLRTLLGDHPDFGVIATGLGDINGDGLPEVVVNTIKGLALYPTAPQDSSVTQPIWSIEIENPLRTYNSGDRDGDGVGDLCVFTKIEDDGGVQQIWTTYSGATGEELHLEGLCPHVRVNLSNGMRPFPQPMDIVKVFEPVIQVFEH